MPAGFLPFFFLPFSFSLLFPPLNSTRAKNSWKPPSWPTPPRLSRAKPSGSACSSAWPPVGILIGKIPATPASPPNSNRNSRPVFRPDPSLGRSRGASSNPETSKSTPTKAKSFSSARSPLPPPSTPRKSTSSPSQHGWSARRSASREKPTYNSRSRSLSRPNQPTPISLPNSRHSCRLLISHPSPFLGPPRQPVGTSACATPATPHAPTFIRLRRIKIRLATPRRAI